MDIALRRPMAPKERFNGLGLLVWLAVLGLALLVWLG
jgi:hypothetical protein